MNSINRNITVKEKAYVVCSFFYNTIINTNLHIANFKNSEANEVFIMLNTPFQEFEIIRCDRNRNDNKANTPYPDYKQN